MSGRLKSSEYLWIHLDAQVSLCDELLIAGCHLGLNPVSKGPAHQCVRNIDHPLSRKFAQVIGLREVYGSVGVLGCLGKELFDAKARVLRHAQIVDAVSAHKLLPSSDQILEKVDSDTVIRWEVRMTIDGRKVVSTQGK